MGSIFMDRTKMWRVPAVLRPRFTWRYILCSLIVLYILYCLLFSKPFFSSKLPQYSGPYKVGTIDVEVPVNRPTIAEDIKFKNSRESAFKLETVLFSLYYPAINDVRSEKAHHYWVPAPLALTAGGFARVAHISNFITDTLFTAGMGILVGSTTIPAHVDVPLHGSVSRSHDDLKDSERFPAFIFSHGFASSRTDYTQYWGELASRGYIVAAIEHRDGSGPGTMIMQKGAADEKRYFFGLKDLTRSDSPIESAELKEVQLNFRQAEIEETARVIRDINAGKGATIYEQNARLEGRDLQNWRDRIAVNNLTVGGHSFGATGALQALKGAPSKSLPFHGGIILDPGKSSGPLNADIDVPIMIIHSNSWSKSHSIFYGRPHFDVVKELVQSVIAKGKAAWFMTSLGTSHPSVTDAPLIEPTLLKWTTGASIDVKEGVMQYVKAAEDFLRYQNTGERTRLLAQDVTHPEYDKPIDPDVGKGTIPNEYGTYWQIHVAPPS